MVKRWSSIGADFPGISSNIPYSLKFSRLKIFAVFAGYRQTTKILSREKFITCCIRTYALTGLTLDHENFIRENLFLSRI